MEKIKVGAVVTLKSQPEHKMTVRRIDQGEVEVVWIQDGEVKREKFEEYVLRVVDKNKAD